MKRIHRNILLFGIVIILFIVIVIVILPSIPRSLVLRISSIKRARAKALPTSFQECDKQFPKIGNFQRTDYIFPFCTWFVEEDGSLYEECISYGGKETNEICELCPGCDCIPAGCDLTYIDPSFVLPTSFGECQKIFSHGGGHNIYENEGKEYCSLIIHKEGIFNKDIGEQLLEDCLSQDGELSEESDYCELKFYEE